jgi:hypothetical protein
LETDWRVALKLSAMALGVIACDAIKVMIARLVGSAIAWKISRRMSSKILFEKPIGCKYIRNYLVSQIFFQRKEHRRLEIARGVKGTPMNARLCVLCACRPAKAVFMGDPCATKNIRHCQKPTSKNVNYYFVHGNTALTTNELVAL